MNPPTLLLDLADAADAARRAGHTETEIACAAGLPDLTPNCRDRATTTPTRPELPTLSAPSHGNPVEMKPQSESGRSEALA